MKSLPLLKFPETALRAGHHMAAHFAAFIARRARAGGMAEDNAERLRALAALLLYAMSRGHVCLDLQQPAVFQDGDQFFKVLTDDLSLPDDLLACLGGCLSSSTQPQATPLIFAEKPFPRLYLRRYWQYELQLQELLQERLVSRGASTGHEALVDQLFTEERVDERQKAAVAQALRSSFSILAGGPGTGKTTIILKVIAGQLTLDPRRRIALVAPTGKAAARMKEAIRDNLDRLDLSPDIRDKAAALETSTLHALLGARAHSPYFRHDRQHPLQVDSLIVDEASMIDLPLMAKLLEALPASASLLLVGDPYQLPSVEVGTIFGDILRITDVQPVVTTLETNFRAREAPHIVRFCKDIQTGPEAVEHVLQRLRSGETASFEWHPVGKPEDLKPLLQLAIERYAGLLDSSQSPEDVLEACAAFRILTALRKGPFGNRHLNDSIGAHLDPDSRLVLITRNDREQHIYNGDLGLQRSANNKDLTWIQGRPQPISSFRIPECEPAYAMTGHKAQGSEFSTVHIVLPPDRACPLLTREWLYTAVSRARHHVTLWASEPALRQCFSAHTLRASGLTPDLK